MYEPFELSKVLSPKSNRHPRPTLRNQSVNSIACLKTNRLLVRNRTKMSAAEQQPATTTPAEAVSTEPTANSANSAAASATPDAAEAAETSKAPATTEMPAADESKEPVAEATPDATKEPVADATPIAQLWTLAKAAAHPEIWGVILADPDSHVPTRIILQKYLNANDGDLARAKDQLTKTLEWRAKMKPLELAKKVFSKTKFDGLGYVTKYVQEGSTEPEGKEVFTWNIYGGVKSIDKTFGKLEE
jgi:hypothetical protein